MDKTFTYRQLDNKLRSLGFTAQTLKGKARIYTHPESNARIVLPDTSFDDEVLGRHLVLARHVLDDFGLGELNGVQNSRR